MRENRRLEVGSLQGSASRKGKFVDPTDVAHGPNCKPDNATSSRLLPYTSSDGATIPKIINITLHLHIDTATLAAMPTERELQINPIVPESVAHNTKVGPFLSRPPPCCLRARISPPPRTPEAQSRLQRSIHHLCLPSIPRHDPFEFSQPPQRLPVPTPLLLRRNRLTHFAVYHCRRSPPYATSQRRSLASALAF